LQRLMLTTIEQSYLTNVTPNFTMLRVLPTKVKQRNLKIKVQIQVNGIKKQLRCIRRP
jgi:hypothetical protein